MTFSRWLARTCVVLGALLVGGCGANYNDRAEAKHAEARAVASNDVIFPYCRPSVPEGTGCDLFLERASQEDYRLRFRDRGCKQKTEVECQELFQQTLDAVLVRRYHRADFDGVKQMCDATPKRCEGPFTYELRLLESHNERVRGALNATQGEIESERRAAADEHAAQTAILFDAVDITLSAIARPSPRCRSYPVLAGGPPIVVIR